MFIPDPGSPTHIFESLLTIFWGNKYHGSLSVGSEFFHRLIDSNFKEYGTLHSHIFLALEQIMQKWSLLVLPVEDIQKQ